MQLRLSQNYTQAEIKGAAADVISVGTAATGQRTSLLAGTQHNVNLLLSRIDYSLCDTQLGHLPISVLASLGPCQSHSHNV